MISCRYVGQMSNVDDRVFDSVGQRAMFAETQFRRVVQGGAAFIPENDFNEVGFTAAELAAYGPAGTRVDPSRSFCDKLAKAQQVFHSIRKMLAEGGNLGNYSGTSVEDALGE